MGWLATMALLCAMDTNDYNTDRCLTQLHRCALIEERSPAPKAKAARKAEPEPLGVWRQRKLEAKDSIPIVFDLAAAVSATATVDDEAIYQCWLRFKRGGSEPK